jgi:hypothetical protein
MRTLLFVALCLVGTGITAVAFQAPQEVDPRQVVAQFETGDLAARTRLCQALPILLEGNRQLSELFEGIDQSEQEKQLSEFLKLNPEYSALLSLVSRAPELKASGYCNDLAAGTAQQQPKKEKRGFWDWLAIGLQIAGDTAKVMGDSMQRQAYTESPYAYSGQPRGTPAVRSNGPLPPGPPAIGPVSSNRLLLYGGPGNATFLGCLNCSTVDAASVWNPVGRYGSPVSQNSVWNKAGQYGSSVSPYSPWNFVGPLPPIIVDSNGKVVGRLTSNQALR